MTPDDVGWVPLSYRYGLREHQIGESLAASRHGPVVDACSSQCEDDTRLRCACPGGSQTRACCQRATQEDRLCDACRDWCWAVDDAKRQHRLIDVYGAVA